MLKLLAKQQAFQKLEITVSKNGENTHFKNRYVTLDTLIDTITPGLNKLDLVICHLVDGNKLVTFLYDSESGESISSSFPLSDDTNPQKVGASITYAKRYNISALLNIQTDEDDDGNKSASLPIKEVKQVKEEKQVTEEKQVFGMSAFNKYEDKFKQQLYDGKTIEEIIDSLSKYDVSDDVKVAIKQLYIDSFKSI